jgi:hypothetical protein
MADVLTEREGPKPAELAEMDAFYRQGGKKRRMAPHIVYSDPHCPHLGCGLHLQAIDFRVEAYGKAILDPLVLAWWNDTGFVGQCPRCGGWIHFTIGGKKAMTPAQAADLPHLPDDWHQVATIL